MEIGLKLHKFLNYIEKIGRVRKMIIKKIIIISILIGCFLSGYIVGALISKQVLTNVPTDVSVQLAKEISVLRPCYMTSQELDNFVKGTPLYGYGKDFLEAEKKTGIGADILLSIACHESDYGRNYWTKYYNQIFSWGVYGGKCRRPYNSTKGCIVGEYHGTVWYEGVPSLIKRLYLTKGGAYYSGETLYAISVHYASDKYWASGVERILNAIPKTEEEEAKEWAVASKVFKPLDVNKGIEEPKDYWIRPLTKRDFAIILYRLNRK